MLMESVPVQVGHKLWKWAIRSAFCGFFAGFAFSTMLLLYFQPQLRPYHEFVNIVMLFLGMSTALSLAFWNLAHRTRKELQVPGYDIREAVRLSEPSTTAHSLAPLSKGLPQRTKQHSPEIPA
jgi:hypothetical protein